MGLAWLSGPVSACHVLGLWEGINFPSPPWRVTQQAYIEGVRQRRCLAPFPPPRHAVLPWRPRPPELRPKCSTHCTRVWVNVCLHRVVFLFQDDIWGHPRNGLLGPNGLDVFLSTFFLPEHELGRASGCPDLLSACLLSRCRLPAHRHSSVNAKEERLPHLWCRWHCWLYCGLLC